MTRLAVTVAVACIACLLFAVAVLVNVAFFTDTPPAAPPDTGTNTTTYPAVTPATSEAPTAVSGDARRATGTTSMQPPASTSAGPVALTP